jgi:hypothetical protein
MKTVYVIPRKGLRLRDPNNSRFFIPEAGTEVAPSPFWTRRANQGDVTIFDKKPEEPKPIAPSVPNSKSGEPA